MAMSEVEVAGRLAMNPFHHDHCLLTIFLLLVIFLVLIHVTPKLIVLLVLVVIIIVIREGDEASFYMAINRVGENWLAGSRVAGARAGATTTLTSITEA